MSTLIYSSKQQSTFVLVAVSLCFILSGFSALLYQTVWMRQFSFVFGTSELAVAAVLSAYMGGLSLGAMIAARYVGRITRPIFFYGILEAGIALSAIAVPLLLNVTRFVYSSLFGGQPEPVSSGGIVQPVFYLFFAFLILAIPTTLMGATLPLLTKYVVRSDSQIGSHVGFLYAVNTLGAVAGVLVAAFILLPSLGLSETVFVGAAVNGLVFLIASGIALIVPFTLSSKKNEQPYSENTKDQTCKNIKTKTMDRQDWILPIMLLSGAVSFVYEVLWTRLLGHVLGGSITAFATMLAGFLSGIAIGSFIGSRFARTREQAFLSFVFAQIGISVSSVLIYEMLPVLIPSEADLGKNVFFAICVLLPATVFIGATFPFSVRILASSKSEVASASARVYSWNTVGAIAGATLAAFWLIPILKYEGSIRLAVFINAILALSVGLIMVNKGQKIALVGSAFAIFIAMFIFVPNVPESILRSSPIKPQREGEIIFYEVGRSATVVVIEENGLFHLRTNGLPEATARQFGAPPERRSQQLLSVFPVLARPDTETMLMIGLGGGVGLESVPASVNSVDVIELEPEVIKANHYYSAQRENNPFDDSRINLIVNDARSALSLTNKKYDAIVSQPSHPWTAGASHLYTKEFMSLSKEHLTEGGIFLQWMNIGFVDEYLLKSLSATMLDVFSYAQMYEAMPGVIFFLGSDKPIDLIYSMANTGRPIKDDVNGYLELGIGAPEDILLALVMDSQAMKEFSLGAPVTTDNHNYMATRSAKMSDIKTALSSENFYQLTKQYDYLTSKNSRYIDEIYPAINYSYISRRLDAMSMRLRAKEMAQKLYEDKNIQSLVVAGLGLQSQGAQDESQEHFLSALAFDPEDEQARYALLKPWFNRIFSGQAVPEYVHQELKNIKGSAAETIKGLQAMELGDMQALFELDTALSSTSPTDLWYTTSVKLRAEWRMQLTNPEIQPLMLNEATEIIDSAIALFLDVQLHMMRIRSTYLAGNTEAALTTAQNLINIIDERVNMHVEASVIDAHTLQLRDVLLLLQEIKVETHQIKQFNKTLDSIHNLQERIIKITS